MWRPNPPRTQFTSCNVLAGALRYNYISGHYAVGVVDDLGYGRNMTFWIPNLPHHSTKKKKKLNKFSEIAGHRIQNQDTKMIRLDKLVINHHKEKLRKQENLYYRPEKPVP